MIYSETQSGSKNILYDLEFLDESESYKSIPELNLMESKRLNQNILSLEEVCEYLNSDYNMTISDIIHEVSSINGVDPNTIAFSINPSTLYENEDIFYLMESLYDNGFSIYKRYDPYSNISQGINCFIEACIESNSLKPLDILEECIFNEQELGSFSDYRQNEPSSADIAKATVKMGAKMALNHVIGTGVDYAAHKLIDSRETDSHGRERTIKHGKIYKPLGINSEDDGFKKFFVDSTINTAKNAVTDVATTKVEQLISKGYSILRGGNSQAQSQMVNKLDNATYMLQRDMHSNPKKRGFFQRIIDKLIALKNKILEVLLGKR